MKITLPFYHTVNGLSGSKEDIWNQLRGSGDSVYSIPDSREAWVKKCMDPFPASVGEAVGWYLESIHARNVFSVGSGGGGMEYNLKKKYPECTLTCSDFEPNTIERLKNVFTECDNFEVFNLMSQPLTHEYVVMSRVETEFTDEELRGIFERSKSKRILLVISDYLSLYRAYILWKDNIVAKVSGRRGPLAGYKRTWYTLNSLWYPFYDVIDHGYLGGLKTVLLDRNRPRWGYAGISGYKGPMNRWGRLI